jgi:hypothetical protein
MTIERADIDEILTCARASSALVRNAAGVWSSVGNNVLRRSYEGGRFCFLAEETRTNSLPRNDFSGGTAGVIGSGGVAPTGMTVVNSLGSGAVTTLAFGTEFGVPYMEVRFQGTSTASAQAGTVTFNAISSVAAAQGQTWVPSCFARVVGGSFPSGGSNVFRFGYIERNGATSLSETVSIVASPTATFARFVAAPRTLTEATTNNLQTYLQMRVDDAVAVDVTIRYYLPQLELGAIATSPIITTGSPVTRQADQIALNAGLLSQLYGGGPISVLTEFEAEYVTGGAAFPRIWQMDAGSGDNRIALLVNEPANATSFDVRANASGSVDQSTAYTSGAAIKIAVRFATDDFAVSRNGGAVVTDTSVTLPNGLINLGIGNDGFNAAAQPARLLRLRRMIIAIGAESDAGLQAWSA